MQGILYVNLDFQKIIFIITPFHIIAPAFDTRYLFFTLLKSFINGNS